MKKSVLVFLALTTVVVATACGKQENVVPPSEEKDADREYVEIAESLVSEVDQNWNLYQSFAKKFRVKIPKKVVVQSCESGAESVEVATTVISNFEADYIVPEAVFVQDVSGVCNKIPVSAQNVKDFFKDGSSGHWKIVVADVKNDNEIIDFIKAQYGKGCAMGEKKPSGETGDTFDVEIITTGPDETEDKICFINWVTNLKFDPLLRKIARFDIGQDGNFYDKNGKPYDTEMAESFYFETY